MTFDEYNTDENFDNDKSSLEELVKKGKEEGKSKDEIRKALSPKWQKSSKINKFDEYYGEDLPKKKEPSADDAVGVKALNSINAVPEAPKSNPPEKPAEEKTAPKVEEMTQTTEALEKEEPEEDNLTAPNLSKGDEKYIKDQRDRAENAEVTELNKIDDRSDYNYKKMYDTISRSSDAYKHIDDKLIAQLPTFATKRYIDGEFGAPESTDAKLRLAYFIVNNVVSKFKKIANADAISRGKGAIFGDTESAYDKYQKSNLEQGLQNRWNKYKAETDNAIALASKETMSEQEARHAVEQLTRNQNMNTMWNTMNENQKLYAMEVTKKIGDYVGNMDLSELGDFIAGAAYEGKMDKDKVIAIGIAKLAENSPEILDKLKEGGMKDMVMSFLGTGATAGIGGALGGGNPAPNGNGTTNLTGNIQNYKTVDGKEISFNFSDPNAGKKIQGVYNDLIKRYKDGEIDEATFKEYYDPMYAESKKHPGSFSTFFSGNAESAIKKANADMRVEFSNKFEQLNLSAAAGNLSPSEYEEKFNEYKEKAMKFGATDKEIEAMDDNRMKEEKIVKAQKKKAEKEAKKKK